MINRIRLYVDEDAMRGIIVVGLRNRNFDVVTATDTAMVNRDDEDHLMTATGLRRALYSHNVGDYQQLHGEWLTQGQNHAGIILGRQQHYSIGEELHRLTRLINELSADEMRNRIEYLSNWA